MRLRSPFPFFRFSAFLTILSVTLTQAAPAWAMRQEGVAGTSKAGLEEALGGPVAATDLSRLIAQFARDPIWTTTGAGWDPAAPLATPQREAEAIRRLGFLFDQHQSQLPAPQEWDQLMAGLLAPGDETVQQVLSGSDPINPLCPACAAFVTRHHRGKASEINPAGLQFDESLIRALHAIENGSVRPPAPEGASEYDLKEIRRIGLARGHPSHGVVLKARGQELIRQVVDLLSQNLRITNVTIAVERSIEGRADSHFMTFSKDSRGRLSLQDRDRSFDLEVTPRGVLFRGEEDLEVRLDDFSEANNPKATVLAVTSLSEGAFQQRLPAGARFATDDELEQTTGCCGINTPFFFSRLRGFLAGLVAMYIQGPLRGPHATGTARHSPGGSLVNKVPGLFGPWLERQVPVPLHPVRPLPGRNLEERAAAQKKAIADMAKAHGLPSDLDLSQVTEEELANGAKGGAVIQGSFGNVEAQRRIPFRPEEILGPPQGTNRRGWYEKIRDSLGIPLFVAVKLLRKQLQQYLKSNLPLEEPEVQKSIEDLRGIGARLDRLRPLVDQALTRQRRAPSPATTTDTTVTAPKPSPSAFPPATARPLVAPRMTAAEAARQEQAVARRRQDLASRGVRVSGEVDLDRIDASFDAHIQSGDRWNIIIQGENTQIGKNVRVYKNAKVIDSVLGNGVLVGEGATVDKSIVQERAEVWRGASVTYTHLAPDQIIYNDMKLERVLVLPPAKPGNRLVAYTSAIARLKQAREPLGNVHLEAIDLDRNEGILPREDRLEPEKEPLENVVLRGGEGVMNIELQGVDPRRVATDVTFLHVGLRAEERMGAVVLKGEVTGIGSRSSIGRGVHLIDTVVQDEVTVADYTGIELSFLGVGTTVIAPRTGDIDPVTKEPRPAIRMVVTGEKVYIRQMMGEVLDNYYVMSGARVENVDARVAINASFGLGSIGQDKDGAGEIHVGSERGPGYRLYPFLLVPEMIPSDEWIHEDGRPVAFTPAVAKAALDKQDDGEWMDRQKRYARDYRRQMEAMQTAPGSVREVEISRKRETVDGQEVLRVEKWTFGAKGVIGEDAKLKNGELEDTFVGNCCRLDGTTGGFSIKNSTLKSSREAPTVGEGGPIVLAGVLVEQGVHLSDVQYRDSVFFEHLHIAHSNGQSNVFLPGAEEEMGQVNYTMFHGADHHPGILLAQVALDYTNISAEATLENHEGFSPRNASVYGRGTFVGGAVAMEFPFDNRKAPWTLIARRLKVPRQRLDHPFGFMMELPADAPAQWRSRGYNQFWPGAYLWRSFGAYIHRRQAALKERSVRYAVQEHRFDRDEEVFNPQNIQAMIDSRNEFSRLPREIRALEKEIRQAVQEGDNAKLGRLLLPVLANRAGYRNIQWPKDERMGAGEFRAIQGAIDQAIQDGNAQLVWDGLTQALAPSRVQWLDSQSQDCCRRFMRSLAETSEAARTALASKTPEAQVALLSAVGRKDWYVGSPSDEDEWRDYDGLGANLMSEGARLSGMAYMTRYVDWYLLNQLTFQAQRVATHAPLASWEDIRQWLGRPFFSNRELVRNYVEAKRAENNAKAQEAKSQLLAIWNDIPDAEKLDLAGRDPEEALQEAVAWDFALAQWEAQMARPLGTYEWESPEKKRASDGKRMEEALGRPWSQVPHRIADWTQADFELHLNALEVMTEWMMSDVQYSGADRWVEMARPTLRDFWATEGVPTISETMNAELENLELFMEDALEQRPPDAERSPTVATLETREGSEKIGQQRQRLARHLNELNRDGEELPALVLPPDYDNNAVRTAFWKLEGNVFPVLWSAGQYPEYGASLDQPLQEIFERRGGRRQAGEIWRQAFDRQWEAEKRIPMAGPAFASAVELLYWWSAQVGHLDPQVFEALRKNDYEAARQLGWIADGLYEQYKSGQLKPDLMGTYTARAGELAILFYLWHARWAVFGGISQHASQPFVSANRIFFGAQNGVLEEHIFNVVRQAHVQYGIRYSSYNDGEVIVNHAQYLFDRHYKNELSDVEREAWDRVDRFLREQRSKEKRPAPESNPWARLAHESEVAIWTAMINLSTDESQFAMDVESALDPGTHAVYSHQRRILIVMDRETGELVLTSELTAASGLKSETEREQAIAAIWEAEARSRKAVEEAKATTALAFIAPEYEQAVDPDAVLARMKTELQQISEAAGPASRARKKELTEKIGAIEAFRELRDKAVQEERQTVAPILKRFALDSIILDGKGVMARIRPVYDSQRGAFKLDVSLMQASVQTVPIVAADGRETKVVKLSDIQVGTYKKPAAAGLEELVFEVETVEINPVQALTGYFPTRAEYSTWEIGQGEREPGVPGGVIGKNWRDYKDRVKLKQTDPTLLPRRFGNRLGRWRRLFWFGEGSSYFVGKFVEFVAKILLPGIEVIVMRPSEALGSIYFAREDHPDRLNPHRDLAILASWSGETDTVRKVAKELQVARYEPDDSVVGVIMVWIGGRVATSLAHIGRTSGGAIDVQTGEEIQVWATKNKAAMNQVGLLFIRDLARQRAGDNFKPGVPVYDRFQSDNEELVGAARHMSSEGQRLAAQRIGSWKGRVKGTEQAFSPGRVNGHNVVGDTPARYEIALKLAEAVNRRTSEYATDDKTYWDSVTPDTFLRDGKPRLWQERSLTHYIATAGTAQNREAADRDLALVRKNVALGIPLVVLTTDQHPHLAEMKRLVAQLGLPEFFVHEVPKVSDALQPVVDEHFYFWLTKYIAEEKGLTPKEIDYPRGLAKTITISSITAFKQLLKSVGKFLVDLKQMITRARGTAPPPRYEEEVVKPREGRPDEAFLYRVPFEYQRIVQDLKDPANRRRGLNGEALRQAFGPELERLTKVTFLVDSASHGAALNLELPAATLLKVGTGIQHATEPFPRPLYELPEYKPEPRLVIALAEEDPEGRMARQIQAFREQGDVVIAVSPDQAVLQATRDSGGTVEVAREHLEVFRNQPLFSAALYIEALGLVLQVAETKRGSDRSSIDQHWQAMERYPWYAAQVLSDRGQHNLINQFAESMAKKKGYDPIEKVEYNKYNNLLVVGGRQSRGSAYGTTQIYRRYGFGVEREDFETSKHGPMAVPPDAWILIVGTDRSQLSTFFSDAKIYYTNLADIWMILPKGGEKDAGYYTSGASGAVTVPQMHEHFNLPIDLLAAEMMAQAYARQWGWDRQQIEQRLKVLEQETQRRRPAGVPQALLDQIDREFATELADLPERAIVQGETVYPRRDAREMLHRVFSDAWIAREVRVDAIDTHYPPGHSLAQHHTAVAVATSASFPGQLRDVLDLVVRELGADLGPIRARSIGGLNVFFLTTSLTLIQWGQIDRGTGRNLMQKLAEAAERPLPEAEQRGGLEEDVDSLTDQALASLDYVLLVLYVDALDHAPSQLPHEDLDGLMDEPQIRAIRAHLASKSLDEVRDARGQLGAALSSMGLMVKRYPGKTHEVVQKYLAQLIGFVKPRHETAEKLTRALEHQAAEAARLAPSVSIPARGIPTEGPGGRPVIPIHAAPNASRVISDADGIRSVPLRVLAAMTRTLVWGGARGSWPMPEGVTSWQGLNLEQRKGLERAADYFKGGYAWVAFDRLSQILALPSPTRHGETRQWELTLPDGRGALALLPENATNFLTDGYGAKEVDPRETGSGSVLLVYDPAAARWMLPVDLREGGPGFKPVYAMHVVAYLPPAEQARLGKDGLRQIFYPIPSAAREWDGKSALERQLLEGLAKLNGIPQDERGEVDLRYVRVISLDGRDRERLIAQELARLSASKEQGGRGLQVADPPHGTLISGIAAAVPPPPDGYTPENPYTILLTGGLGTQAMILAMAAGGRALPEGVVVSVVFVPGEVNDPEYLAKQSPEHPIGGAQDWPEPAQEAMRRWLDPSQPGLADRLMAGEPLLSSAISGTTLLIFIPTTPVGILGNPIPGQEGIPAFTSTPDGTEVQYHAVVAQERNLFIERVTAQPRLDVAVTPYNPPPDIPMTPPAERQAAAVYVEGWVRNLLVAEPRLEEALLAEIVRRAVGVLGAFHDQGVAQVVVIPHPSREGNRSLLLSVAHDRMHLTRDASGTVSDMGGEMGFTSGGAFRGLGVNLFEVNNMGAAALQPVAGEFERRLRFTRAVLEAVGDPAFRTFPRGAMVELQRARQDYQRQGRPIVHSTEDPSATEARAIVALAVPDEPSFLPLADQVRQAFQAASPDGAFGLYQETPLVEMQYRIPAEPPDQPSERPIRVAAFVVTGYVEDPKFGSAVDTLRSNLQELASAGITAGLEEAGAAARSEAFSRLPGVMQGFRGLGELSYVPGAMDATTGVVLDLSAGLEEAVGALNLPRGFAGVVLVDPDLLLKAEGLTGQLLDSALSVFYVAEGKFAQALQQAIGSVRGGVSRILVYSTRPEFQVQAAADAGGRDIPVVVRAGRRVVEILKELGAEAGEALNRLLELIEASAGLEQYL